MSADLGARLQRAGLITRAQLADAMASAPRNGAALVGALVRHGIAESALAGFFVAEGMGPLLEASDLAGADPGLVARLPAQLLAELMVLPIREREGRWVVAMAAPTERLATQEVERITGATVVPATARWSDLETALARLGARLEATRAAEEPPVIALVHRRSSPPSPATTPADRGYRVCSTGPPSSLGSSGKLALDDGEAVPLVRQKPVSREASAPSSPTRIVAKSFPAPTAAWSRSRASTRPIETVSVTVEEAGNGRSRALAGIGREPLSAPVPERSPERMPGRGETLAQARREPTSSPEAEPLEPKPLEPKPLEPKPLEAEPLEAKREPEPADPLEDRWMLPPEARPRGRPRASRSTDAAAKPSPRAAREAAPIKPTLPDAGPVLAGIRQARDRDVVVRMALEGALGVCRSAVFFALRRGVLKGWDALGAGVTQDSARNLWIPTSTPSLFQRVVESGAGYFGPYGTAIADGLFRAAVGSRGGDLALLPVKVAGKVVGLLACDDVRGGPPAQQRLELLAHAVDDAFARIIVEQKHGT